MDAARRQGNLTTGFRVVLQMLVMQQICDVRPEGLSRVGEADRPPFSAPNLCTVRPMLTVPECLLRNGWTRSSFNHLGVLLLVSLWLCAPAAPLHS
jgi:hypothetical protein